MNDEQRKQINNYQSSDNVIKHKDAVRICVEMLEEYTDIKSEDIEWICSEFEQKCLVGEAKEKLNEDEIYIPYYIKEYLLNEVDRYYNAGNTLRCACRMTIRHFLADIDVRLELNEEHKLIDNLENLWNEREKKELDYITKYHSECVDFIFYKNKQIGLSNGGDDIVIDLEDLKTLNKIVKELSWNE